LKQNLESVEAEKTALVEKEGQILEQMQSFKGDKDEELTKAKKELEELKASKESEMDELKTKVK